MLEVIATRRKAWIGHVVRGDGLLKLVIEGRMEDKRSNDRPRIGMVDDIVRGSYEHDYDYVHKIQHRKFLAFVIILKGDIPSFI